MFPFPLSLVGRRWLVRRREFPGHGAGTRRPGSGLCARRPVRAPSVTIGPRLALSVLPLGTPILLRVSTRFWSVGWFCLSVWCFLFYIPHVSEIM